MHIYVFGLGHIGLPLAAFIALTGKQVTGIDINADVIKKIKNGNICMSEYYKGKHISEIVNDLLEKRMLNVSTRFKRLNNKPAVFIITVGIGVKEDSSQDLTPLENVLTKIIPKLVPEDLILFRTTMIPGTCENYILPKLKSLDIPVHLAYCPETISETHAFEEFENNPKVLGGSDENSYKVAEVFLSSLSDAHIYKASNIRTAEMVKVAQNISRDVDIAFVNELSEAASALEVDIYEIQQLANTHPRVKLLQPGPGVGGYCIPNALGYLRDALIDKGIPLKLMNTARKINSEKPYKVVEVVRNALKDSNKNIKGSSIAVIGLAMKDFCADFRLSPALDIISILINEGAKVKAYDPIVPLNYSFQTNSFKECIKDADCLIIAVNQVGISYSLDELQALMAKPLIVVDTRNIVPRFPGVKLYKI